MKLTEEAVFRIRKNIKLRDKLKDGLHISRSHIFYLLKNNNKNNLLTSFYAVDLICREEKMQYSDVIIRNL
jgi:hypothetical protein